MTQQELDKIVEQHQHWLKKDCEGWERVPYWLDGFIPLAYQLEDEDLIARAKKYIDAIIERQQEDGWIAPCPKERRNEYDMWAVFLICKVLALYADCAKEEDKAEKIMGNVFSLLLISSILLIIVGYLFKKPILYLFGASDASYIYANEYLRIYLLD